MVSRAINLNTNSTLSLDDFVIYVPANGDTAQKMLIRDLVRSVEFTIATLPTPSTAYKRDVVYVSDGAGAGNAVLAFCDGTNWRRSDTLAILV